MGEVLFIIILLWDMPPVLPAMLGLKQGSCQQSNKPRGSVPVPACGCPSPRASIGQYQSQINNALWLRLRESSLKIGFPEISWWLRRCEHWLVAGVDGERGAGGECQGSDIEESGEIVASPLYFQGFVAAPSVKPVTTPA